VTLPYPAGILQGRYTDPLGVVDAPDFRSHPLTWPFKLDPL